jgi:succinate dehydrogenase / fumarate reductase cytochrome b subunit
MAIPGYKAPRIPSAFIWRRLQSFTGFWLSGYLLFHLLTNSQAALLIGNDGKGFIHDVNSINNLPYLPLLEMLILGLPIIIHAVWGIKYAKEAKFNSFGNGQNEPTLPNYPRNKAYTWQRITSYILVFALIAHIVHMRFIERPIETQKGAQTYYMVRVNLDQGLYTLAPRLGVELYDKDQIQLQKDAALKSGIPEDTLHSFVFSLRDLFEKPVVKEDEKPQELVQEQKKFEEHQWVHALESKKLGKGQAIAVSKDIGTAMLLMLRETFKMPVMLVLYTLFVLIACFHGFNGLWTFLITWGVTLSQRTQDLFRKISYALMAFVAFLGLATVWLTYWINLKQ